MRICIIGAGAIGGLIGARLAARAGCQPAVLARGATLRALREHGWRADTAGEVLQAPARVVEHAEELGEQDLVILAVKGPALREVASGLAPLLGESTIVMPAMNGVPWWFCAARPGLDPTPLRSVDPGGRIAAAIELRRVLGCVVHATTSVPEPGLSLHRGPARLIIGEPGGGHSQRAEQVCAVLQLAGFETVHSEDVRRDIWYKLWGNLTMNPVSALTGATIEQMLGDPLVLAFCNSAMREARALGERLGCPIEQTPEERNQITMRLGAFKTSMLQDLEAGRALELDAIVGAVQELARRMDLPTPTIDAVLGLTRLMARVRGLYPWPESGAAA